jgi:cytochrome oxidase Cu insertion factor (SCO1/SenC/PrrC family)
MNKKKLKIILAIILFGVISFFLYKIMYKVQEKNSISNRIKTIPDFDFTALNNKEFKKVNLKPNMPTVFFYFNSECDFCQHETQSIRVAIDKFNDIQLIFVSTEPIEEIKMFSEQYNLNNKRNIVFLHDSTDSFSNQFNATSIPYILIYNKDKELIKKYNGQINASGILRVLNK